MSRAALLWAAYLLVWCVILPGGLISSSRTSVMALRQLVLDCAGAAHGVSFFYGIAVAWFLFAYLCRGRSTNFIAALPLRRETVFLTNYLSGLLCSLGPNFLIMGLTILAGCGRNANVVAEAGIWFAAHSMTYLFYYSFAVLCAMLVGQIVAIPLLYGVLNLSAVVVEAMLRELSSALIYGIPNNSAFFFSWLSPIYYFVFENHGPRYDAFWDGAQLKGLQFRGWGGLFAVAGAGLVFAAAAFWCYRRRRMEASGDVMAVRHLRPVFRWCFTIGFTVVVGVLLATLLTDTLSTSCFYAVSACLLIAAIGGYFLSEMILSKSLRVFVKKNLLHCGGVCIVVVALLACCRLDVLGIARYIPAYDEIKGVVLSDGQSTIQDPALIRQTLNLHKQILNAQHTTEQQIREADWSPLLSIRYVKKDGTTVSRAYYLPITPQTTADSSSLIHQYEDLSNQPAAILSREVPGTFRAQDIDYCLVYYWTDDTASMQSVLDLSSQQAMTLWKDAILKDLEAGNLGRLQYTNYYDSSDYYTGTSIELALRDSANSRSERLFYSYPIPITAVNTICALKQLGVPAVAFRPVS